MEELIEQLLKTVSQFEDVDSCSRIDGEDAIGIEMEDGSEYFLNVTEA